MLEDIRNFPVACRKTLRTKIIVPKYYKKTKNLIISGMGNGPGIVGDILKDWLEDTIKIPIEVSRRYKLPAYADKNTLLICISYSGSTKETLSQLEQGIKRKCKIFGITSGGKLENKLKQLKIPWIKVPTGMLSRTSLPYLLFSAIAILKKLAYINQNISLDTLQKNKKIIEKSAFMFAKSIKGTFPIIYSTYMSTCRRFKNQLNENAKVIAKYEILPELNHHEIESWINLNKKFSVILLREGSERKEIKKSIEFLKSTIKRKANYFEIFAKGKTKLERILYLIWFGDFTSYYLAKANKVNPSETKYIEMLKAKL